MYPHENDELMKTIPKHVGATRWVALRAGECLMASVGMGDPPDFVSKPRGFCANVVILYNYMRFVCRTVFISRLSLRNSIVLRQAHRVAPTYEVFKMGGKTIPSLRISHNQDSVCGCCDCSNTCMKANRDHGSKPQESGGIVSSHL